MDSERILGFVFGFFVVLLARNDSVGACPKEELVMVQMIFNHGSVAPPKPYPTDPNPSTIWKEGLGDLTMLGKFQPYALGTVLRNLYDFFITSDPTEVEVLSSEKKAAVKSAQSLVAALYVPNPDWEFVRNFSWQPMYIKYVPEYEDQYFAQPPCPAADVEYEDVLLSFEAQEYLFQYKYMLNYWSKHSGWKIRNWDNVQQLFNVLQIEDRYNLTIPSWARRYWDKLEYLSEISFYWKYKTKLLQRLRTGSLVDLILQTMKKKALGSIDTKVFLYSTHIDNVAGLLNALNLWNYKEPPPCATVLVELYKHNNTRHFVRLLYLNSSTPEKEPLVVHSLELDGCTEFCPLSYFEDYTKAIVPMDWKQECQII